MKSIYYIIISSISGLSTMLGALISLNIKKKSNKIITFSLAFSAAVMQIISIFDLIPESIKYFNNLFDFFSFLIIGIILGLLSEKCFNIDKNKKLYRIGLITMLALIIHNIPEGIITYITTENNFYLGISIASAIAIHNIPEGIATSLPIYYDTNNKKKAYFFTFISAISEPFGAIIAATFIKNYVTNNLLGILFSLTAGIMLYISIFELLKTSLEYKKIKITIIGIIIGIIIGLTPIILI